MRDFSREELIKIAKRCNVPVFIYPQKPEPTIYPYIEFFEKTSGALLCHKTILRNFWWGDNADTAAVVIQKYLRKFECFLMIGKDGFNMVGRDINLDYNYKWYASWTTAVLEAGLVSGK